MSNLVDNTYGWFNSRFFMNWRGFKIWTTALWAISTTNWNLPRFSPTCFARRKVGEISICCTNFSRGSYSNFDLPIDLMNCWKMFPFDKWNIWNERYQQKINWERGARSEKQKKGTMIEKEQTRNKQGKNKE